MFLPVRKSRLILYCFISKSTGFSPIIAFFYAFDVVTEFLKESKIPISRVLSALAPSLRIGIQ